MLCYFVCFSLQCTCTKLKTWPWNSLLRRGSDTHCINPLHTKWVQAQSRIDWSGHDWSCLTDHVWNIHVGTLAQGITTHTVQATNRSIRTSVYILCFMFSFYHPNTYCDQMLTLNQSCTWMIWSPVTFPQKYVCWLSSNPGISVSSTSSPVRANIL